MTEHAGKSDCDFGGLVWMAGVLVDTIEDSGMLQGIA